MFDSSDNGLAPLISNDFILELSQLQGSEHHTTYMRRGGQRGD